MKTAHDFTIIPEPSGKTPNFGPMASSFARAIEEAFDADGNFNDQALEAEFQEWIKAKAGKEIA